MKLNIAFAGEPLWLRRLKPDPLWLRRLKPDPLNLM